MIAEFTTLVGLIASFKQIRDSRTNSTKADVQEEFLEFLVSHNFGSIKDSLTKSDERLEQLGELLLMESSDISAKLTTIENVVVSISTRIDGLKGPAGDSVRANAITDQAIMILLEMEKSELGEAHFIDESSSCFLDIQPLGTGIIEPTEKRYFREDVETLLALGWLVQAGYKGTFPVMRITRSGSKAARIIG